MDHYLYLILVLGSVAFPLGASWDKRFVYVKKWSALFPAIAAVGAFFIAWDVCFTNIGVWGFNPQYLVGLDIINLPLEEWLFFILIPFACVFIYESTNYFFTKRSFKPYARKFTQLIGILILAIGLLNYQKWYTSVTFILAALFLFYHLKFIKRDYLDRFWVGYLFSLIPFLIVNGVLTGSGIIDQVVWYNDAQNLGIRLGTIPIEDSVYLLLLLMSTITIYESKLKRF
jgi:lycopene cyclase domain-containing protein